MHHGRRLVCVNPFPPCQPFECRQKFTVLATIQLEEDRSAAGHSVTRRNTVLSSSFLFFGVLSLTTGARGLPRLVSSNHVKCGGMAVKTSTNGLEQSCRCKWLWKYRDGFFDLQSHGTAAHEHHQGGWV